MLRASLPKAKGSISRFPLIQMRYPGHAGLSHVGPGRAGFGVSSLAGPHPSPVAGPESPFGEAGATAPPLPKIQNMGGPGRQADGEAGLFPHHHHHFQFLFVVVVLLLLLFIFNETDSIKTKTTTEDPK